MAGNVGMEEMGEPAGGHHRHGLAIFFLDAALISSVDQPDIAPIDRPDCMAAHRVLAR